MLPLRRHIATFFLLCLLALSVPREWIHHHDEVQTESFSDGVQFSETCHVCDLEYCADKPADLNVVTPAFRSLEIVYHAFIPFADLDSSAPLTNKAPPVTPC